MPISSGTHAAPRSTPISSHPSCVTTGQRHGSTSPPRPSSTFAPPACTPSGPGGPNGSPPGGNGPSCCVPTAKPTSTPAGGPTPTTPTHRPDKLTLYQPP